MVDRSAPANWASARSAARIGTRATLTVLVVWFGLILGGILFLNDGKLVYSLDDAYIHLALAENLTHGHYGVNLGEVSAPSSSILWPFLLAPFAQLPFAHEVPLVFNLLAAFGVVWLTVRILMRVLDAREPSKRAFALVCSTILFLPAFNLLGLVFTGMEHTLQLFLSLALLWGLIREAESGSASAWLLVPLVAGPLIRYENLVLSLPAIAYLALRHHFVIAGLALGLIGAALASFSLFLHSHGLPLLPSSVLVKSEVVEGGGRLTALLANLEENVQGRQGALLSLGTVLLAFTALRPGVSGPTRLLAAAIAVATAGHLVGGRFGWLSRYEIYIWGTALLALLYVYTGAVRRFVDGHSTVATGLLAAALVLATCPKYLYHSLVAPLASNNIYEQHYQMRRFAVEFYGAPVAVNDLGLVAYRNDQFVLDLWGLSSPQALELRRSRTDSLWLNAFAESHGVEVAMIYRNWFGPLPQNWTPIADLHLSRRKVAPWGSVVNFYALNPQARAEAESALAEMARHMPRIHLVVHAPKE